MKTLLLCLAFCGALLGQNAAKYPGAVASQSDLGIATNRAETTLLVGINSSATSLSVASASQFRAGMYVTIDNEFLAICGVGSNTLTVGKSSCPNVDGRGVDTANGSSSAASHVAGRPVQARISAWHHNQVAAEIGAIEDVLVNGSATVAAKNLSVAVKAACDGSTDDTPAVLAAISAAPAGAVLKFPERGDCIVGSLGTLTKIVKFDFGHSTIRPATSGAWITTSFIGDQEPFIFMNGVFRQAPGYTPTDIFVLVGQPNPKLRDISFYLATASHALVWNKAVYGLSITGGTYHYNTAPNLIYGSQAAAGDDSTFTYAMYVQNIDMSNNTARCVALEGGDVSISDSVIESCSGGGIEHIGNYWYLNTLTLKHVGMEANQQFNLKFPAKSGNPDTDIFSNVIIEGSSFVSNPSNQALLLGEITLLQFLGNKIHSGCIDSGFTNLRGYVQVHANSSAGAPAGCDSGTQYLFSTAVKDAVNRIGSGASFSSGLFGFYVSTNPMTTRTLNGAAGAKAQVWQDESGAEVGSITREGNATYSGKVQGASAQISGATATGAQTETSTAHVHNSNSATAQLWHFLTEDGVNAHYTYWTRYPTAYSDPSKRKLVEIGVSDGGDISLVAGTNIRLSGALKFTTGNTTGATAFAPGGANCPAITCTTPYTWITASAADGSTVYIPVFK